MNSIKSLTKLIVVSLFIVSCSSSDDDSSPPTQLPTGITYTNTINSIMSQNCNVSGCHTTTAMAAGFALSTYDEVKFAFQNRGALGQIESGNMPKNRDDLSEATINNIKGWMAENYPE
ncbi:MAG: hypothetical protein QM478_04330 [Flavobacteriaceae bacterium]